MLSCCCGCFYKKRSPSYCKSLSELNTADAERSHVAGLDPSDPIWGLQAELTDSFDNFGSSNEWSFLGVAAAASTTDLHDISMTDMFGIEREQGHFEVVNESRIGSTALPTEELQEYVSQQRADELPSAY
jgi:hypothetical protein